VGEAQGAIRGEGTMRNKTKKEKMMKQKKQGFTLVEIMIVD
jgi:competence protein ComGC